MDYSEKNKNYYGPLDGLRAISIIAVLLYHSNSRYLTGGFLGVETFFVISGFIITTLLQNEFLTSSRIDLRSFYIRRIRRLMPTLFAAIFLTLCTVVLFFPEEIKKTVEDLFPSVSYTSNWYYIFSNKSYFEKIGRPRLLEHLWSLSVEFQYYLIWPFICLIIFKMRMRWKLLITIAGALASSYLMAYLYNPNIDTSRIYFGSDTRASALLLGSALALRFPKIKDSMINNKYFSSSVSLLALYGVVMSYIFFDKDSNFLYQGGFLVCALLSAICIGSSLLNKNIFTSKFLGSTIMTQIGMRAYNIYIWHWPVFCFTQPRLDVKFDGWKLFAIRLILTLILTEISYRYIDIPFRKGIAGQFFKDFTKRGYKLKVKVVISVLVIGILGLTTAGVCLRWNKASGNEFSTVAIHQKSIIEKDYSKLKTSNNKITLPKIADDLSKENHSAKNEISKPNNEIDYENHKTKSSQPEEESDYKDLFRCDYDPSLGYVTRIYPGYETKRKFLAIGDSVMLVAANLMYCTWGDNINIDAKVSRQFPAASGLLSEYREKGILGDIIIIHLGTNDYIDEQELRSTLDIIRDRKKVFLMNVKVPCEWEDANNILLDNVSRDYSNVSILDWKGISVNNTGIFDADETHLTEVGTQLYTNFIMDAVRKFE